MLEGAEAAGFAREAVLAEAGLSSAVVDDPDGLVAWSTLVAVTDALARLSHGDDTRVVDVGRAMRGAPSFASVRQLARTVISSSTLFGLAVRWVAPAMAPHLPLRARFISEHRLELHGEIPSSYAPCRAFFLVFEGNIRILPTMLGLPEAVILERRLTDRTCDFLVALPESRSIAQRLRHRVRSVLGAREAIEVLEEYRRDLSVDVEHLRRAREELRAVLDRLPDVVIVHAAGTILWANRAAISTIGAGERDLMGSLLIDVVAEASRAAVLEHLAATPDLVSSGRLLEVVLVGHDGREITMELAAPQAVMFDGAPARILVGRDVTERKAMQQRLLVADRLASVGLLAAGVAHEVNNPLAYVLNNIEMARKELSGLGVEVEVSRHVLSVALEGVDRIRTIVRDLLMLSRGDDGPVGPIDVKRVVASTLSLAVREIERTAHLESIVEDAPYVVASDSRIAQVLLNLVTNGLESMRDKPREDSHLTVRIGSASDGRLLLEVADTGCGIAAADLARIFEPFFTTKPAGQGTGLGLAIAHRVVVELGGELTVRSERGVGTTFRVLLPAYGMPVASDEPPAPSSRADEVIARGPPRFGDLAE